MPSLTTRRPRQIIATALVAAALVVVGAIGASARSGFSDVSAQDVHEPGIDWLVASEVTVGCGGDRFCPADGVTRAQMATFLHRLSGQAPGTAPSVDAATVGGQTPDELRGATGPQGEPGPTGPQGEPGPTGRQGEPGVVDDEVLAALTDRLDALEATAADQTTTIASLEDRLADAEAALAVERERVDDLEALLDGAERVTVHGQDTLRFGAMNVQVVNGTGTTAGAPNALGNLIVGYAEAAPGGSNTAGSHYLVVGSEHSYTSFGGLVAGLRNVASGEWATATGGTQGTASGSRSSVSGGFGNHAAGLAASVTGGQENVAGGSGSSVSGGIMNRTSAWGSAVLGGQSNRASADFSSVAGGDGNTVSSSASSILGGRGQTLGGGSASHYPE